MARRTYGCGCNPSSFRFQARSLSASSLRPFRASDRLADSSSFCRTWARNTLQDLANVAQQVVGDSRTSKDLTGLFTSFTANDPQLLVTIDRKKAGALGVPISQVSPALGVYMGSEYVNDFNFNNRSYRVYVQADQPFRMTSSDLRKYYVRSNTNGLIPLDNIVNITQGSGPQVINHYNLFRSVEIDGAPAPGLSSSQGQAAMVKLVQKHMLQGMSL